MSVPSAVVSLDTLVRIVGSRLAMQPDSNATASSLGVAFDTSHCTAAALRAQVRWLSLWNLSCTLVGEHGVKCVRFLLLVLVSQQSSLVPGTARVS